jgi:hypothetical protein
MRIAQPSILSLRVYRNQDYDSQRGNDPSPIREVRVLDYRFLPAVAIVLEGELGALRACPRNMLKVAAFIVPFLLPSGRRIGHETRGSQNLD